MFANRLKVVFWLSSPCKNRQMLTRNSTSAATETVYDRDPAPHFFSKEVQKLLQKLTRPDPKKVFRRRLDSRKLEAPEYQFMTNEQLEEAQRKATDKMWELLQMPPIVKVREEDERVLSKDPELQCWDMHKSKYIFTDITFGLADRDRIIAVREPSGTLRLARWEEKDRMNQIYNPKIGREINTPKMFYEENLQPIFERGDYEFVLDRACTQFEPDHPLFHQVTQATYDHVNKEMAYEKLRSTRHYGPMVFYLAWIKKLDNLLIENLTMEKIEDATLAIKVYYILNPSENQVHEEDNVKLINHYIENDSSNKQKLQNAFRLYLELEKERELVQENIAKAHGIVKDGDEESKN